MMMMVVMKMRYEKITLVRMSTDSPPIEAPKIVFTIAKATTPPSAPVDCVDHDDYDDNIDEEDNGDDDDEDNTFLSSSHLNGNPPEIPR